MRTARRSVVKLIRGLKGEGVLHVRLRDGTEGFVAACIPDEALMVIEDSLRRALVKSRRRARNPAGPQIDMTRDEE